MSTYKKIKDETAEITGIRVVRRSNTIRAHGVVRDAILANPTLSYAKIADLLGCSHWLIYTTAAKFGIRRTRGACSPARRKTRFEVDSEKE